MNVNKLTAKLQQALGDAQSWRLGVGISFIAPVHLMSALLAQDGGSVRHLLTAAEVQVDRLRSGLGDALAKMAVVEDSDGEVHVANDLVRLFNIADKLAQDAAMQLSPAKFLCWRRCRIKVFWVRYCATPVHPKMRLPMP